MHLILTGATGLVGSAVLHQMLISPSISQVSILSRRPVPQAEGHEKAKVIIHKDFTSYPATILEQLKGAEGVVWAQGISATEVTKEYVPSYPPKSLGMMLMDTKGNTKKSHTTTHSLPHTPSHPSQLHPPNPSNSFTSPAKAPPPPQGSSRRISVS